MEKSLIYKKIMHELQTQILNGDYQETMKLPDERTLSQTFDVSRSSIKRALKLLADKGAVFQKRGSGTFINPLFVKNDSVFHYKNGSNLGISDSFQMNGQSPKIKLLSFNVERCPKELAKDLFIKDTDFVYAFKRLRSFDDQSFMIETGYIPIKILPQLEAKTLTESLFKYVEQVKKQGVTKSYLTIGVSPSNEEDRTELNLLSTEPVGTLSGIFFLDDGTPFEYSQMRLRYDYMNYHTFVSLED